MRAMLRAEGIEALIAATQLQLVAEVLDFFLSFLMVRMLWVTIWMVRVTLNILRLIQSICRS